MSEPLLNVMKIMLLAGLYLFFVRVLWSVYNELRDPRTRVTGQASSLAGPPAAFPTGTTSGPTSGGATVRRPALVSAGAPAAPGSPAVAPAAQIATLDTGRPRAPATGRITMIAPHQGLAWDIADAITVGRADTCGIRIDDTYVSGIHARIFSTDTGYMIEDLESRNGTVLNGHALAPGMAVPLQPGDRLHFGTASLEFE